MQKTSERRLLNLQRRQKQANDLALRFGMELAVEAARIHREESASYAEIAAVLDVSRGRAQQLVERGSGA